MQSWEVETAARHERWWGAKGSGKTVKCEACASARQNGVKRAEGMRARYGTAVVYLT